MSRVTNLDYPGLGGNPGLPGVAPHELEVDHSVRGSHFDELINPWRPALDKREGVPRVSRLGPVLRGFSSVLDHIPSQFHLRKTRRRGLSVYKRTCLVCQHPNDVLVRFAQDDMGSRAEIQARVNARVSFRYQWVKSSGKVVRYIAKLELMGSSLVPDISRHERDPMPSAATTTSAPRRSPFPSTAPPSVSVSK